MKSLRHRLPPLNSLLVFEAAGRTLNFTLAASELHVSQAAISKQIKFLEQHLGFALFERVGRRVTLTAQGARFHDKVSASLNYLADAVEEQTCDSQRTRITLAANTAVSHYWLNHGINDFYRQYPDSSLDIRMITSDSTRDLFDSEVDIAVAYEPGQRIGWQLEKLFDETLFPVASPGYPEIAELTISEPADLLTLKLLDFERLEPNWINWKVWFESLGVNSNKLSISNQFNNYIMLIDAAKRGLGITLGTRYLLDRKLADGELIRVSDYSVSSGRSYWLAINESLSEAGEGRLLANWLRHYQSPVPDSDSDT